MDPGRTPERVGCAHLPDEIPYLVVDPWASAASSGLPPPVCMESAPMPADDGLGLDNGDCLRIDGNTGIVGTATQTAVDPGSLGALAWVLCVFGR